MYNSFTPAAGRTPFAHFGALCYIWDMAKTPAKKRFGQNFLQDEQVLDEIVAACGAGSGDLVLEIGPGKGVLTTRLAEVAGRVVAVEIDTDLRRDLDAALSGLQNVKILYQDILKTDLTRLREEENDGKAFVVVANLPYYISTPVIMKLLQDDLPPSSCTVMVQKELALRMAASPGGKDYGELSVVTQFYAQPEVVCTVPPSAFYPQPKVDSCVLRLLPHEAPPVTPKDRQFFFHVVKEAFAHRRKTLINSLSACGDPRLTKSNIADALKQLPATGEGTVDESIRAERLTMAQFAALSDLLL